MFFLGITARNGLLFMRIQQNISTFIRHNTMLCLKQAAHSPATAAPSGFLRQVLPRVERYPMRQDAAIAA
jgi:hypothetical protein